MSDSTPAPDLDPLRVLVANSNAHSRSILRIALRAVGVRDVVDAGDADAAVVAAETGRLDAALIEQDSLGLDGAAVVRRIRRTASQEVSRLPIVMVAAQASAVSVAAARDCGVNAFLLRPVSSALIKVRLVTALTDARPFIRAQVYVGPDRRFRSATHGFPPRRFGDDTPPLAGWPGRR